MGNLGKPPCCAPSGHDPLTFLLMQQILIEPDFVPGVCIKEASYLTCSQVIDHYMDHSGCHWLLAPRGQPCETEYNIVGPQT